jgi:hypothetical protein
MSHRTNFTISEANLEWLQAQAPGERGISRLLDSILQKERTLGPLERRMERHVANWERMTPPDRNTLS